MEAAQQQRPPQRFWRLIKHGDSWYEYHGDAVKLIGAIVGLSVNHGVSLSWLERLLQNPSNAAAEHVRNARNQGGRVRIQDVRRWYERDSNQPRLKWDRDTWHEQLQQLEELATVSGWPMWLRTQRPKVKGADARKVFAAHLQAALSSSGIDYPASVRWVADHANVSDAAATRATKLLVDVGVIKSRRPPGEIGPFTTSWYRIDASGNALCQLLDTDSVTAEAAELAQFATHAVWRHGNTLRFDVWAQVVTGDGQSTISAITESTDCSRATVRRVIARMVAVGLIEELDDGTYRALTVDHRTALDAVALETGMTARHQRQVERHEAERRSHVQTILRTPRLLAAAMRRKVRAVVEAMQVIHADTGEVVSMSAGEDLPSTLRVVYGHNAANAPPIAVTV